MLGAPALVTVETPTVAANGSVTVAPVDAVTSGVTALASAASLGAVLSPAHQVEFLSIVRASEQTGDAQFIIATHSPLLMAYPDAILLHLTDQGIIEGSFESTERLPSQYRPHILLLSKQLRLFSLFL